MLLTYVRAPPAQDVPAGKHVGRGAAQKQESDLSPDEHKGGEGGAHDQEAGDAVFGHRWWVDVRAAACVCRTRVSDGESAEVFFDDVRVPQSYRIGEEGMGFQYQVRTCCCGVCGCDYIYDCVCGRGLHSLPERHRIPGVRRCSSSRRSA